MFFEIFTELDVLLLDTVLIKSRDKKKTNNSAESGKA